MARYVKIQIFFFLKKSVLLQLIQIWKMSASRDKNNLTRKSYRNYFEYTNSKVN